MNCASALPRRRVTVLAIAVSTVLLSSAAVAETQRDPNVLDEVVVTATKRAEAISDTPAAITALTAESLGAGGVSSITDLSAVAPNLSVGDQFGVNRTFIRGVGLTSIDLGADGAVAFLQNEAVIARPAEQLSGFFDLEQVEVLRGPQGTTYGRGATAGVVNLITRKPTQEVQGYADMTYGNYNAATFEGAVGGGITDKFSARIATKIEKRDGYGQNLFTGNPVDDRNAYAVRLSLRYQPSADLTMDLVTDHFKENDYNYAFHYFGPTVTDDNGIPAKAVFGGTTIFDHGGDIRNIWSREDAINQRDGSSVTGIVDYKPGTYELKSVTSYRKFKRFNRDDLGVSDALFYGQNNYTEVSNSISQEFTLSAAAGGVDWLAGAMLFHENNPGSVRVPLVNLYVLLSGGQCTPLAAQTTPPTLAPCNALDSFNYEQSGEVKTDAYGIFLQGTKELAPRLKLTLGARFNSEKRAGTGSFVFGPTVNVPTDKEHTWTAVTPRAMLEYRTESGALVYGSVTRGFKSGVINIGSENDIINPEFVTSFETGFKNKIAGGRATYSVSAFYYDYKDLQVGFVNAQSVVQTINAAKAHNYGLEFETQARFLPQLTGDLSLSFLSAKYTDFLTGDYRQGFAQVNLSGNYLANAPRSSGRAGLTWEIPAGPAGQVIVHGEAVYSGKVYFTEFNNSDAEQSAYTLLNATVGFESADKKWSVTGWVRNATDKLVMANNIVSAPLYASVRVGTLLPPRTFGATIGFKF